MVKRRRKRAGERPNLSIAKAKLPRGTIKRKRLGAFDPMFDMPKFAENEGFV